MLNVLKYIQISNTMKYILGTIAIVATVIGVGALLLLSPQKEDLEGLHEKRFGLIS